MTALEEQAEYTAEVLERIASALERLADALEHVTFDGRVKVSGLVVTREDRP